MPHPVAGAGQCGGRACFRIGYLAQCKHLTSNSRVQDGTQSEPGFVGRLRGQASGLCGERRRNWATHERTFWAEGGGVGAAPLQGTQTSSFGQGRRRALQLGECWPPGGARANQASPAPPTARCPELWNCAVVETLPRRGDVNFTSSMPKPMSSDAVDHVPIFFAGPQRRPVFMLRRVSAAVMPLLAGLSAAEAAAAVRRRNLASPRRRSRYL